MLLSNFPLSKRSNLIIILIFTLLYFPLLFARTDLWDGVILSHSIQSGRNQIIVQWFTEAGLTLTSWFYLPLSISFFKNFYPLLGQLLSLLGLLLSALEIGKIAQHLYKINDTKRFYVVIFYILLPVWASFFSTVFLMHSVTIFMALLCSRLVISDKNIVLAYVLVIITFQQASLAPLILSILMLDLIENKNKRYFKYIIFATWLVLSFFIVRNIFPTSGLYSDYNKINLAAIFVSQYWKEFAQTIILYCGMIFFLLIFKPKYLFSISFISLVVAIIATIIPYVSVAKYPLMMETFTMHSHSMRFMFSCAPILALFLAFALSKKITSDWFVLPLAIFMMWLFYSAQIAKVRDVVYQRALITAIQKHPELNGKVVNFINNTELRPYEYADAFIKAFGKNNSYQLINNRNPYPKDLLLNEGYLEKYMLPDHVPSARVDVKVSSVIEQASFLSLYFKYFTGNNFEGYVILTIH